MVMLSNEIVGLRLNYADYILSKGVLYETAELFLFFRSPLN